MANMYRNCFALITLSLTVFGYTEDMSSLDGTGDEYEVSVDIKSSPNAERFRRSANVFPQQLDADLRLYESTIHLRLKRNDHINPGVRVYVQKNGRIQEIKVPRGKQHAFYQDVNHLASVSISCHGGYYRDGECIHEMSGQLLIHNEHHTIIPMTSQPVRPYPLVPDIQHKVRRIHGLADLTHDYIYPDKDKKAIVTNRTDESTRRTRAATVYNVEVLPVLDYPIYNCWYQRSTAATASAKNLDALDKIREFYAHIMNAMDVRYQSIVAAYQISTVYAGIFVANDPTVSTWTEDIKVGASPRNQVDSSEALGKFNTWRSTAYGLPEHDHGMAFTGYDLVSDGSTSNAGLAYLGAVCDADAVSIVEDHHNPIAPIVAAHELAHNLNASHDGSGNACLNSAGKVMATSVGVSTDPAIGLNHLVFSTCSVDYFTAYIADLDANDNNCLSTLSAGYNPNFLDEYTKLPGQGFSLDDQCRILQDSSDSYFCRGFLENTMAVCQYIYCATPASTSCTTGMAWDGTTCANSKICINGQCVADSRAQSTLSDTCVFGDSPAIIANGMTCSALISAQSYRCYPEFDVLSSCCVSCASVYNCDADCGYGDKTSGCDNASCPSYTQASRDLCCKTCASQSLQCTTTQQTTTPSTITLTAATSEAVVEITEITDLEIALYTTLGVVVTAGLTGGAVVVILKCAHATKVVPLV